MLVCSEAAENGLRLYRAFHPERFTTDASHSPISAAIGCHARHGPAPPEQFGGWASRSGTPMAGIKRRLSDCQTSALTS